MTTLITGANGFIGSHLLRRVPDAYPLTRENADLGIPLPPLPRAHSVIHCAAELDDPSLMREVNVGGTLRLVQWAAENGVKVFVLLSTGGVGGVGPYAETKREAEEVARQAGKSLRVQIVRVFFAYGPGQSSSRLVPRLADRIRSGEAVRVDPSEGPTLSLTYISDIVEGIVRIAGAAGSHVVDLGGPPVTMQKLARCVGRAIGREPRFEVAPTSGNDLIADSAALQALTGFLPAIGVEEGIPQSLAATEQARDPIAPREVKTC